MCTYAVADLAHICKRKTAQTGDRTKHHLTDALIEPARDKTTAI